VSNATHLFCLSYAGASAAAVYGRWKAILGPNIETIPLELPGHGARMMEEFYTSMEDVVDDCWNRINKIQGINSYAIFGHSLGAIIAYELAKKARSVGDQRLKVVFVSASRPPHLGFDNLSLSQLSDQELIKHCCGGSDGASELVKREAVVKMFLPPLRNDYRLAENYRFHQPIVPMASHVICLQGSQDKLISKAQGQQWSMYSSRDFSHYVFSGSHLFINSCTKEICSLISENLSASEKLCRVI